MGYPMMPQMMGPGGRGGGQRPGGAYPMQPYGVMPQQGRGGRGPVPANRGRGRGPGGPIPGRCPTGQQPIKFNQQARNAAPPPPQGSMPPGAQQQHPPGPQPQAEAALTASALASATPEMQKNMIGERLYPLIHASQPELAGKITGMLLEMDNSELLHLLESPDALNAKISEALQVLEAHNSSS